MRLWDKGHDLDAVIERYTVGDDPRLDLVLLPYDCEASIAHARVLEAAGVLTTDEADRLVEALETLRGRAEAGEIEIAVEEEDGHTAIENRLTEALGDLGKKIHTGRSRNDQVVAALRLYTRARLDEIRGLVGDLAAAARRRIDADGDVELPGYTHMRKAMPSSVGLWLGALAEGLDDDLVLLDAARSLIDRNPLGSAAGYGVPGLELDRELGARLLGFAGVQRNTLAVQNGRGKLEAAVVAALAAVMADLNRLASDLVVFTMPEFGFFALPRDLCTGSSIMPQKVNPDALELMRARAHEVTACEIAIRGIASNAVSGYHRDMQRTKKPLLESLDLTADSLVVARHVVDRLEIDREACARGMSDELYATQRVYELVRQGVPFRDAYRRIAASLFRPEDGG